MVFLCSENDVADTAWVTNNQGVDAWIRLTFDALYQVYSMHFAQRMTSNVDEKINGIEISMDGFSKTVSHITLIRQGFREPMCGPW